MELLTGLNANNVKVIKLDTTNNNKSEREMKVQLFKPTKRIVVICIL